MAGGKRVDYSETGVERIHGSGKGETEQQTWASVKRGDTSVKTRSGMNCKANYTTGKNNHRGISSGGLQLQVVALITTLGRPKFD